MGRDAAMGLSTSSNAFLSLADNSMSASLYQKYQTLAHRKPATPKIQNEVRQPQRVRIGTTSRGESAPPSRLALQTNPCARARSSAGNQRLMLPEILG